MNDDAQSQDQDREAQSRQDDPKPGAPKRAHRDFVDGGKHDNKDTRRELREKH